MQFVTRKAACLTKWAFEYHVVSVLRVKMSECIAFYMDAKKVRLKAELEGAIASIVVCFVNCKGKCFSHYL